MPSRESASVATSPDRIRSVKNTQTAVRGIGRWSADDFWRALHDGGLVDSRAPLPA
jgi:hypothetical protein